MTDAPSDFIGPYRGLEPFDESAMAFFFGRERESRLVTASLFASPLTLLYGASGVGKSSVLRAGVLPQLRERPNVLPVVFPRFSTTPGERFVERGWQTDPVSGIKETAALTLFATAPEGSDELKGYRDVVLAHDMAPLRETLEAIARLSKRLVMVILDQFEEYSLYHPRDDELFAQQFPRAVASPRRDVAFLVSLREDALAKLDRFKATIPTLWDSYRRIEHLDAAAGEAAIRKPLDEYNRRLPPGKPSVSIEDSLVGQVLSDVQAGAFGIGETGRGNVATPTGEPLRVETPYLQLVMTRLWERELEEGSPVLRASTFQSEGKAEKIVQTHLERVMAHFSPEERDLAARMFDRLVTPGGSKIALAAADLAQYESVSDEVVRPILQRLEQGNRRILRRVADPASPAAEPRYEIFHDRLGRAMLAWRTAYLAERERDAASRRQAEQKRLEEESLRDVERRVSTAMESIGPGGQRVWAAMMFYLVDSKGVRHRPTESSLVARSGEKPAAVKDVLRRLGRAHIVREAFGSKRGSSPDPVHEIVDDLTAAALLEWHSRYVTQQGDDGSRPAAPAPGARPSGPTFPYDVVARLLLAGDVVPFVGAGVTASGAAPAVSPGRSRALTSGALKEEIARACQFPATEFDSSDVAEVASYFVQRLSRSQLDGLLAHRIGPTPVPPSATHAFLADVAHVLQKEARPPLVILTTNYDRLMEEALTLRQVRFDVLAYLPDDADRRDRVALFRDGGRQADVDRASKIELDRTRTLVFRLHGTADGSPGSYVLTEEDYIDWILRLRGRDPWMPPRLLSFVTDRHLLSLGHSARDWSQRALWRVLGEGRRRSWTVSLHPSPLSIMTWQRYDVQIYNEDLNAWTERMRVSAGIEGAASPAAKRPKRTSSKRGGPKKKIGS